MFQLPVDDEITLVLAEERHAQVMTDLIRRNQRRLARWEPWAEQPQTVDGTRAYIRASLEDFVRGRQISTIIALEGGQLLIGRCGLRINPYAASADVGYWVDADYQGRGIVTRSARALISSSFRELGLSKMELRTSVDNVRSRAVAPSGWGRVNCAAWTSPSPSVARTIRVTASPSASVKLPSQRTIASLPGGGSSGAASVHVRPPLALYSTSMMP